MRGMALAFARRAQPLTVALADTHPGNFIVDRSGLAWFVDLEKVHVGSPAIDLAHATLADLDALASRCRQSAVTRRGAGLLRPVSREGREEAGGRRCSRGSCRCAGSPGFSTTLFMARWRVQTRSPRDPADPTQWSDAGLEPAMKAHIDARIDQCFRRETIQSIRSEWMA